jgi:hypothetical protein
MPVMRGSRFSHISSACPGPPAQHHRSSRMSSLAPVISPNCFRLQDQKRAQDEQTRQTAFALEAKVYNKRATWQSAHAREVTVVQVVEITVDGCPRPEKGLWKRPGIFLRSVPLLYIYHPLRCGGHAGNPGRVRAMGPDGSLFMMRAERAIDMSTRFTLIAGAGSDSLNANDLPGVSVTTTSTISGLPYFRRASSTL